MRCNFVDIFSSFLCTIYVSSQSGCYCDSLSSREITLLHRYYATIRLPKLHQLSLLYYRLFNLLSFLERHLRISRVANLSYYPACHALQPRSSLMELVLCSIKCWFPEGVRCHPACLNLTRLNHFNLRLRPTVLRTSYLTFGVTSACPMLAIWWLTYLTRVGITPTGIIDLARPYTHFFFMT